MPRPRAILFTSVALIAAGGCASSSPAPRPPATEPALSSASQPLESPQLATSSLAFTPPVARDLPEMDLDRDARGPVAYSGYEDQVVSQTWVYQDDDQNYLAHGGRSNGDFSRFQRRAITSTVTVRSR